MSSGSFAIGLPTFNTHLVTQHRWAAHPVKSHNSEMKILPIKFPPALVYLVGCDTVYGNLFSFQAKNELRISYSSQSAALLVKHPVDAFKCYLQKKALYHYSDATWMPHGSRALLAQLCTY